MTLPDQYPITESSVVRAKRHPWSRAEVRFGAIVIALVLAALAVSHVVNAGHPARGTPFGGVTSAPVMATPTTPNPARP